MLRSAKRRTESMMLSMQHGQLLRRELFLEVVLHFSGEANNCMCLQAWAVKNDIRIVLKLDNTLNTLYSGLLKCIVEAVYCVPKIDVTIYPFTSTTP